MSSRRFPLALGLVGALAVPAAAHASAPQGYIVMLKAEPLATYAGGTQGIPATSPKVTGSKINAASGAAANYRRYLDGRQEAALRSAPGASSKVIYSYRTAFAGFAARIDAAQAAKLRSSPLVARVWKVEMRQVNQVPAAPDPADPAQVTSSLGGSGAPFLGLTQAGQLWSQLGGANNAGEGVIIGDIDTGITPEHPSFADDPADGYVGLPYGPPPASWKGTCEDDAGDDSWDPSDCNNKLIGARYFTKGIEDASGNLPDDPDLFLSARDEDGHGTHTSSTAAGNFGVDPVFQGNTLGVDRESGIAPRARIAEYKACWPQGCATSDLVAAIDAAVKDGVDVINYSIGSDGSSLLSADGQAFLNASEAGVFAAVSAGNAGPKPGSVGDPATMPWVAGVAADTLPRDFKSTISFGGSASSLANVTGTSAGGAVTSAPLIAAEDAALPGIDPADAKLCGEDELDPSKVTGKIVVCTRGGPSRVATSAHVQDAGGVGEILVNASDPNDLAAYPFFLPTVTVSAADGNPIRAAAKAGGATASWTAGTATAVPGKVLAAFSSRGPQNASPDIAKPDLSAPGVSVLAGNTPSPYAPDKGSAPGQLYQVISGTSMAAPHVAGAAALVNQAHPTLTPSEIKSALMLTADPTVKAEDGTSTATPFDGGSGEIDPTAAANAGLVLNETTDDYIRYLGTQDPSIATVDSALEPVDLNLASIAASQVTGDLTTTRVFTSIDTSRTTWNVTVNAPAGFTGSASKSSFTIAAGQSIPVSFTFTQTTAPAKQWAFGSITLSDGERTLRIPVSLQPLPLIAPRRLKITTDQPAGSQDLALKTGYTGTLNGRGFGLAPADVKAAQTVTTNAGGTTPLDFSGADPSVKIYRFDVPEGAKLLETSIENVDGGASGSDLDLYVLRDADNNGSFTASEQVASSATGSAEETVSTLLPEAGKYAVAVVGFATKSPSTFDLSTWVVGDTTADQADGAQPGLSLTGDPVATTIGQTATLKTDWARVLAKGSYRGVAAIDAGPPGDVADATALTVVQLDKTADTAGPSPAPSPTPAPTPGVTPVPGVSPAPSPPAKASITLTRASISGRILTVTITLSRKARVGVLISRSGRTIRHLSARTLQPGTRTVRIPISGNRLARGREYGVRLLVGSATSARLVVRAR